MDLTPTLFVSPDGDIYCATHGADRIDPATWHEQPLGRLLQDGQVGCPTCADHAVAAGSYYGRAVLLDRELAAAGNLTAWADVYDNRAEIEWEADEILDPDGEYWHDFAVGLDVLFRGPAALD